MAWIDNLQGVYTITTGDGREYQPLWKPTGKSIEYNVTEFEFAEVSGTLVHREQPKGTRHDIELYFTGEDCIDVAREFELSANDPRLWTISHPYHGRLSVQPLGLRFDYTRYNSVVVTGNVMETITSDNPKTSIIPADRITRDKQDLDDTLSEMYASTVTSPQVQEINDMTAKTTLLYNIGKKVVKTTEDAEVYFNLFNDALSKILVATSAPLLAIQAIQAVISQPYLFEDSVKNRLAMLADQFNALRETIVEATTPADKRLFENNGAGIISSMCATSAAPQEGDYGNRNDVIASVDPITSAYNQYVADLDSLQTDNGGDLDSYVPDPASLLGLNDLVNFTVSNLFDIALDSKQERAVILEKDSNVILLAHRFYGLKADDSTIDDLIRNNGIGLNELLQIRKNREILYYI